MTSYNIELLAPAKNLECGIAAINHGADAVYIGEQNFGARHAAANSIRDIETLCQYAHQFGVKVYATVNTIIYNDEMNEALMTIERLEKVGIDAILVQDMGLMMQYKDKHPDSSLEFHASTQTDNRSSEKVKWLRSVGFKRVVLARELSAIEINDIHNDVPDVELEVFVHGALCVSYSGQCYASEHCLSRSANRGECAQLCRMKYALEDSTMTRVAEDAYYLSLKDQCQIDNLPALIKAGACSLKIEGRLKDVTYVKNVVAAYNQKLNELGVKRSSWGNIKLDFQPDLQRSFNRGYTDYFLNGRHEAIASLMTPKAIGEYVGKVKEIRHGRNFSFNVSTTASFVNGDGLCFMNQNNEMVGFRVNRVEGNRIFPHRMPAGLLPGTPLYRSQDHAFDLMMASQTAKRSISLILNLSDCGSFITLTVSSNEAPLRGIANLDIQRQVAQKPQKDNILRQLSKLGDTIYQAEEIIIDQSLNDVFIPSSQIADLRRRTVDNIHVISALENKTSPTSPLPITPLPPLRGTEGVSSVPVPDDIYHQHYGYLYNISNDSAAHFYQQHGISNPSNAYELRDKLHSPAQYHQDEPLLMQCRYCIRHEMGYCFRKGKKAPWRDPLFLRLSDGCRFRLDFDCKHCQMNVIACEH